MPWLFNPSNMTQTLTMNNGLTLRLPARKRHYLAPQLMSGDIRGKVDRKLVRNLGEDRVVKQQGVNSVTSSDHHKDHGMVGAVSVTKSTEDESKKVSARKRSTRKNASTGKKKKSG